MIWPFMVYKSSFSLLISSLLTPSPYAVILSRRGLVDRLALHFFTQVINFQVWTSRKCLRTLDLFRVDCFLQGLHGFIPVTLSRCSHFAALLGGLRSKCYTCHDLCLYDLHSDPISWFYFRLHRFVSGFFLPTLSVFVFAVFVLFLLDIGQENYEDVLFLSFPCLFLSLCLCLFLFNFAIWSGDYVGSYCSRVELL